MRKCKRFGHTRVVYSTGKSDCLQCKRISAARSRAKPENRAKKNEAAARRRAEPGYKEEYARRRRIKLYGIEDPPDGPCELCERPATDVDHDHISGKFRGFLCRYCNVRVAIIEDVEFVAKAQEYIAAAEYVKERLAAPTMVYTDTVNTSEWYGEWGEKQPCRVCGQILTPGATIWYTAYSGDKPIACNHMTTDQLEV